MTGWSQPHQPSDLYQVLGLGPDASHTEIVRAYRQQARAVHPDAQPADPGAAARFRELTRAYEVLSDPARRDAYDRQRAPLTPDAPVAPPKPPGPGPAVTWLGRRRPAWPGSAVGAPLWAGPVHVQPPAGAAGSGGHDRQPDAASRAALLAYLIRRYLGDEGWVDQGRADRGWPL